MFICCSISYWQACVHLDCTSVQMLQEQITWSKILTSETNRYIFYKILITNCIVLRFSHMSPTFWRAGALVPQNWNSWLEHRRPEHDNPVLLIWAPRISVYSPRPKSKICSQVFPIHIVIHVYIYWKENLTWPKHSLPSRFKGSYQFLCTILVWLGRKN